MQVRWVFPVGLSIHHLPVDRRRCRSRMTGQTFDLWHHAFIQETKRQPRCLLGMQQDSTENEQPTPLAPKDGATKEIEPRPDGRGTEYNLL